MLIFELKCTSFKTQLLTSLLPHGRKLKVIDILHVNDHKYGIKFRFKFC